MNFKNLLSQLDQLSEATKETEKGRVHTAEPGGYGRKFDTDEEGDEKDDKKKEPAVKRGRGRPKKGADSETGQVAKYDNAKNLQSFMVGNIPKKGLPGKPGKKHSIKEWIEEVEAKYVAETSPGQQLTVKPMPGAAQLVDPASNKVMATGDAAAVKNIQGAVAQGKVQMRGDSEMAESEDDYSAKKARAGKDIGKPGKQFGKIAASAGKKYGSKAAGERVAGAVLSKLRQKTNEADIPSDQVDMGAGLGAGRNVKTLESKAKPDFLDIDKDKNKKESMKDAAKDAKDSKKKKMNESGHRHSAAKLTGKAHALAKEAYNCKYDDMEEARMYHEGFKEGLDECYGQGVYEEAPAMPPATTGGMAQQAMEDDMMEMDKSEWMRHKAKTTPGNTFNAFGQTMNDTDVLEMDSMAFESLDRQLNALLTEGEQVEEGMTVSISKGQQGMPNTVSVSAQDSEADQLLSIIKQAGLGLFGDELKSDYGAPSDGEMTQQHDGIDVVGDHDGMMALIKKVTGAGGDDSHDYEDEDGHEGHDHDHVGEETCNECGMMESNCECEKEPVDEVESYQQEEEQIAETDLEALQKLAGTVPKREEMDESNPPDSDAAETTADENAEAQEDMALAQADELNELDTSTIQSYKDKADPWNRAKSGDASDALRRYEKGQAAANKRLGQPSDEEKVTEWANDAGQSAEEFDEETFTTSKKFMTDTIAGGLNKPKSTGQTTIPVVASQLGRQVARESIADWKKLAGI